MGNKELEEDAKKLIKNGIGSVRGLKNALATLRELESSVNYWRKKARLAAEVCGELSRICGEYATENEKCFGENVLRENGKLKSGDIAIVDCDAHYAITVGEYKRISGEQKTQAFLESLPGGWTKRKIDLSATNINKLLERGKITEQDLADNDLARVPKHKWSWSINGVPAQEENGDE